MKERAFIPSLQPRCWLAYSFLVLFSFTTLGQYGWATPVQGEFIFLLVTGSVLCGPLAVWLGLHGPPLALRNHPLWLGALSLAAAIFALPIAGALLAVFVVLKGWKAWFIVRHIFAFLLPDHLGRDIYEATLGQGGVFANPAHSASSLFSFLISTPTIVYLGAAFLLLVDGAWEQRILLQRLYDHERKRQRLYKQQRERLRRQFVGWLGGGTFLYGGACLLLMGKQIPFIAWLILWFYWWMAAVGTWPAGWIKKWWQQRISFSYWKCRWREKGEEQRGE